MDDKATALTWEGQPIEASAAGHKAKPGDKVCVVLRPEAIQCSTAADATANRMQGKIRQRVFKGNHTSLLVEVADGRRLSALVHPGEMSELSGDDVWIGWKPQNATVIPDRATAG